MIRRAVIAWGPGYNYLTSGTGLLIAGAGCVTYNAAYETTGAASATVAFYDGDSANGLLLAYYTLSSGQSTSESQPLHTLVYERGLYVVTVAGTAAGTAGVWADHHCLKWVVAGHGGALAEIAEAAAVLGA